MEIYASWVRGLPQDKEALEILRRSRVVIGVEMSNVDEQVEMVQGAGLKFSSHTPGGILNLASPRIFQAFDGEQGERLLRVIRMSDPSVVGFHLGYSAEEVVKMRAFPNLPEPGTIITNSGILYSRIGLAARHLELSINRAFPDPPKTVLLEPLDYAREGQSVPWDLQSDEVKARRQELEEVIKLHGVNAALLYVTDWDFVRDVFNFSPRPIGFLWDVGHNFISADSKIHAGRFTGTVEDYFRQMLNAVSDLTYQIHINVPGGNDETGYLDHHLPLGDDALSQRIIALTKIVYEATKNHLMLITLEMKASDPTTTPVQHAKQMVAQAERLIKELEVAT